MSRFFKFLAIVFLFFSLKYCFSQKEKKSTKNNIVELAKQQLGTPYLYGGKSSQTGFDCSGLVYFVYTQNGISVPRSSYNYKNKGQKIALEDAQVGDIILFRGYRDSLRIGHVGIISKIEGNNLWFIHSSSGKKHWGVIESNFNQTAYKKRFVGIRRF